MHIQRSPHLKKLWWDDPVFPKPPSRVSRNRADVMSSEENILSVSVKRSTKRQSIGYFSPSRRWIPFTKIGGIHHGYITELYTLRELAKRYGISQATERYWRKHILPEPIQIVRRRSVTAHHWSKIQLIVLDEILCNLENNGVQYFTKKYDDHINLLHYGCQVLEKHFAELHEFEAYNTYDRYGVSLE